MFDRFTEQAKQSMNRARMASQRLGHEYLGTEHMLLGLLDVGDCSAAKVLRAANIDPIDLRGRIEKLVEKGIPGQKFGQLPFTPRARKALELSMEAADALRDTYIGTEHLLLGLAHEPQGVGGQVLRSAGLDRKTAGAIVAKMTDRQEDPQARPGPAPASLPLPGPLNAVALLQMAKTLLERDRKRETVRAVDEALRVLETEK